MRLVIADTSPLNYLILIDLIEILPQLYGTVTVPEEVLAELNHPRTPRKVLDWLRTAPDWLKVQAIPNIQETVLNEFGGGERAVLLLAEQQGRNVLLLLDDALARIEAGKRDISTVGTLGLLRAASRENLVDLSSALMQLLNTNFRVSPQLVAQLLAEDRARKSGVS